MALTFKQLHMRRARIRICLVKGNAGEPSVAPQHGLKDNSPSQRLSPVRGEPYCSPTDDVDLMATVKSLSQMLPRSIDWQND